MTDRTIRDRLGEALRATLVPHECTRHPWAGESERYRMRWRADADALLAELAKVGLTIGETDD